MSKTFNLNSSSDMHKFNEHLKKAALEEAQNSICENGIELECPHCHKQVKVKPGINTCAYCRNKIDINLKF